jgi:hypothetical protein
LAAPALLDVARIWGGRQLVIQQSWDYTSIRMKKALILGCSYPPGTLLRAEDLPAAQPSAPVGETATVCGKVTGVHYAANSRGKPTFINFDRPYPSQNFTVMIWDDDQAGFPNVDGWTGHQLCARGVIKVYRASRR